MPSTAVTFATAEDDGSVVDEYFEELLNLPHWFFELDCKTWRAISVRERQLNKGEYLIRVHDSELTPTLTDLIERALHIGFTRSAEVLRKERLRHTLPFTVRER